MSCFRCLFLSVLVLGLVCLPARAEVLEYGPNSLVVEIPAGFVDAASISSALMDQALEQTGDDVVLLKLYLPDNMALYYADGRLDVITRQVWLYGFPKSESQVLERRALELMARTLEETHLAYATLPSDTRRNRISSEHAMRQAVHKGENLLVNSFQTDTLMGYITLLSYPQEGGHFLTTAMCTALVQINQTIVIINASSIVQDMPISPHAAWVRSAVESVADMLASANKDPA